jgi:hypothetical protein
MYLRGIGGTKDLLFIVFNFYSIRRAVVHTIDTGAVKISLDNSCLRCKHYSGVWLLFSALVPVDRSKYLF